MSQRLDRLETAARLGRSETAARLGRIDTLLALAADPDPTAATARLRWLRRFVLGWSVARSLVWMTFGATLDSTLLGLATAWLAVAAGLACVPRHETLAARVALPALLLELGTTFPFTPNHFFLELYAVTLLAFAGADGRDDALVLAGLRWLAAIVLLLTGCQKLAFGQYWTGDFLAFMVGRGDRFAALFQWVLAPAEVARLQGYDPFRGGSGPYRVASPLFLLLSNLVWVAEILLPIGLLWRTTRAIAVWIAVAFVLAIQLGARELGFALLFVNLLLLFAPARAARALATASLVMVAAIATAALGLSPESTLIRGWHLW